MTEAQYNLFGGSVPAKPEGAPPPGSRKTASLLDWAEVQRRRAEAELQQELAEIIEEVPELWQ